MSSQALSENHLAHDEVSEVLENGGILRDSPILTLQPAPVPALPRYSFQHGELYGEDVRLEDENGEPTDQWACASIPGYLIYDRLASGYVAFAYEATLAEKLVAFLNAETR